MRTSISFKSGFTGGFVVALTLAVGLAAPRAARAQEGPDGTSARSIGLGVERSLSGLSSAAFVYDGGKFHIDALLGFALISDDVGNDDTTVLALGGRFWYSIAQTTQADFNVGGGIIIDSQSTDDNASGNDNTDLSLEGGVQIRAFLVPNVAFTGAAGLVIAVDDDANSVFGNNDGYIALTGVAGTFGMIYFF